MKMNPNGIEIAIGLGKLLICPANSETKTGIMIARLGKQVAVGEKLTKENMPKEADILISFCTKKDVDRLIKILEVCKMLFAKKAKNEN
ncbi:MAG: hypothetical protein WC373_12860 [Smithella sp.]|jgi:hypothetical protein